MPAPGPGVPDIKKNLDEFRAVIRDMEDQERHLLLERNAKAQRSFRQTKAAIFLGSILGLLIPLGAGWIVREGHHVAVGTVSRYIAADVILHPVGKCGGGFGIGHGDFSGCGTGADVRTRAAAASPPNFWPLYAQKARRPRVATVSDPYRP